ncbi:MAG: curli-like amyloid fiber formation chaperone CsgH [Methyloligellaceae bacterium]
MAYISAFIGFFLSALVALGISGVFAAAKPLKVIGWVSLKQDKRNAEKVRLRALAYSKRPVNGRFLFSLVRKGPGGIAQSNQSGAFSTSGGQSHILSQTTINLPKSGVFRATLQLLINDKVVFSTVLENKH